MLRITVQLVPRGIFKPIKIGELYIRNNLTGTLKSGNYSYVLRGKKNSSNVWKLIYLILKDKYCK